MIGYLEGTLLKKEEDRVLLLANQVGYEVMVPPVVMEDLKEKVIGDEVALYIYYQQTERQPKPVLIGFTHVAQKEFFQLFISVEDIGPMKAVKAFHRSVQEIAGAIESKDLDRLKMLKGIGTRTAKKIIASLQGKMDRFVAPADKGPEQMPPTDLFVQQVLDVMITQLGHKTGEAKEMIRAAMERNRHISTAEALFEEVYRSRVVS